MSLVLKNVSKTFVGKVAVDNISFSIEKPGVYGLLGTNGAGKTTTIRMLLGIIKKDSGEITWKGKEVDRENVNFGYLPEERGVYPKTKIMDQLMYFAELKGMKKDDAITAINKWAKELKVEEYLQMPAEKLSKGNQQKIQFMNAIIHNPELVVLDEPFSGLDPVNTEILKNIIIDLVKNGKYVIMSAHQMATIEEFCSDILILNKGKTVLQGNLKQIKETYPANRVEIDVKQDIDTYIKEFNLEIENVANYNYVIKINDEGTALLSAKAFLEPELLDAVLDMSNITAYLGIITIIYFILGYFTYALLYALTGSTVSKPEDIQSANSPVAILAVVGFYLSYFTMINPTSELNVFASLFPISSPFCMPFRIMMGLASGTDVAISIAILLVTILVIAKVAIKIYSNAILNYVTKMSLKDIIKIYKDKQN